MRVAREMAHMPLRDDTFTAIVVDAGRINGGLARRLNDDVANAINRERFLYVVVLDASAVWVPATDNSGVMRWGWAGGAIDSDQSHAR